MVTIESKMDWRAKASEIVPEVTRFPMGYWEIPRVRNFCPSNVEGTGAAFFRITPLSMRGKVPQFRISKVASVVLTSKGFASLVSPPKVSYSEIPQRRW